MSASRQPPWTGTVHQSHPVIVYRDILKIYKPALCSIQRYPDNFQTHTLVHRERPKHIPNLVYNSDLNSANHNYGLTYDANGSEQDIETGCKYTDL